MLSRRRLGFHEKGIFLWCQNELFHPIVQIDLSENRDKNLFDDVRGPSGALGYDITSEEWDFRTYTKIIAAYTPRKLSFPSDAENAIGGILNRLSHLNATRFVFGLPEDDLERALLWTTVEDDEFEVCLLRRRGFPSWSWLGWSGEIEYSCWLVNPVLVDLPTENLAYNKHTLAIRGAQTRPEGTCDIIVPTRARLRIVTTGTLEIESKLARFKAVVMRKKNNSNDLGGNSGMIRGSAVPSETTEQPADTGNFWQIVDRHGSEVPIGVTFASSSGTYFYVDSETSRRLTEVPGQTVELVFLQRWYEISTAGPYDQRYIDDRVWVMVVLRNLDGTAERIALTTIPYDFWRAADPVPSVVCIV